MVERTRGRKRQRIRALVLSANPLCVHCQQEGKVALAEEVDHILPLHKGGTDDFGNLQGLCQSHHQIKTARDEGKRVMYGCDINGNPLDPGSHWSKPR
jgi:5-methylcytosine-specific restriction endonuclease McrA